MIWWKKLPISDSAKLCGNFQSEPQEKKKLKRVCNDHNDDDEAFSVEQFDVLVKLTNELQVRRSVRSTKVEVCD